jgi:hypothetical protein
MGETENAARGNPRAAWLPNGTRVAQSPATEGTALPDHSSTLLGFGS